MQQEGSDFSSLCDRMDQQMAALDSLQSMLDSPPNTRMPCPRAAAAAAAAQANMPDVLAYMASSRFEPSALSSLAQQVRCWWCQMRQMLQLEP